MNMVFMTATLYGGRKESVLPFLVCSCHGVHGLPGQGKIPAAEKVDVKYFNCLLIKIPYIHSRKNLNTFHFFLLYTATS